MKQKITSHIPSMKNIDSHSHVRGESIYVDDIPERQGTLHGAIVTSSIAHGKILSIDYSKALKQPGVVRILTYKDIPGQNQIGGIIPDEPLFAKKEVHFQGQPIALILASTELEARLALHHVEITYKAKKAVVDPIEAYNKGMLHIPSRTFQLGNTTNAWKKCAHVIEGKADTDGQEHLYLETQGAYAYPVENGHITLVSSTQGPTAVQRTAAKVLGIPMHKIEVDVRRLGGGFGGKEDQATAWGVMAALAAQVCQCPVKLILHRMDDMKMTGKRNPYRSTYKIGLDKNLNILAFEADYYQNAGAAADLSPAILERTLFHCTNAYYVPHVTARAHSCITHIPPNTAFRGFGGPQGMFVMEAAIAKAAREIGVPARAIQKKNLLSNGQVFPYGQKVEECQAQPTWAGLEKKHSLHKIDKELQAFNKKHDHLKKGLAIMPICFGISFTNTPMNHARALIHIYQDGSVGISTAAVEMGQGVNTKMVQVAAKVLSIDASRIKIESTNTTRVANTSPSAASSTADLNGKAVEMACHALVKRLTKVAAKNLNAKLSDVTLKDENIYIKKKKSSFGWEALIQAAFLARVSLTENAHYSTPKIHFDKSKEKGHPFAYHVYGTAAFVVTVDCIRGRYDFDAVHVVHDFGTSMNRIIDLGQMEGGLVQGIGWMTMEELLYNQDGRLMSNALSTYKIPDIYSVPKEINVTFLHTDGNDMAIFKSKAVGEPPLLYGIGAYFAILDAVQQFNPKFEPEIYHAPFTPEKVLMGLYGDF